MGNRSPRPVALEARASSGIGLATAAVLLAAGYEVIGAARARWSLI